MVSDDDDDDGNCSTGRLQGPEVECVLAGVYCCCCDYHTHCYCYHCLLLTLFVDRKKENCEKAEV